MLRRFFFVKVAAMRPGSCLVTSFDCLGLKQGKMIIHSLLFSLIFYLVQGEGEFIIVRSPPSIEFEGDEPIDQNLIPDICSVCLGFTTKQESDWQGIKILDPFHFAEAVVILYVDGITSLGSSSDLPKFLVDISRDEETTWSEVKNEILKRFPSENSTLLRIELGSGNNDLRDVETEHLSKDVEEDVYFLNELKDLEAYSSDADKRDGIPDLYWFVLKGLHNLNDIKGSYDPSTIEAKEKVYEALSRLGEIYGNAYQGRALVAAVVSDASHTRRTRSAIEEEVPKNSSDINAASETDPDFPAIFNIILWFSVAFILSLIAISVFIAKMDPGRDSIIYRMTSNRMKKDS